MISSNLSSLHLHCVHFYSPSGCGKSHTMSGEIIDHLFYWWCLYPLIDTLIPFMTRQRDRNTHRKRVVFCLGRRQHDNCHASICWAMRKQGMQGIYVHYIIWLQWQTSFANSFCSVFIQDLLSPSLSDVKIRDNDNGSVQLSNATSLDISTPDDLINAIQLAKSQRATEMTDKNGQSSRSHAVCQLQIKVTRYNDM
jgi:hypothetical protein